MEKFDGIIIGSGQGGNPLAKRLSTEGWNIALIERESLGGTCINYGCTPTKAMIASARAAYQARRSGEFGIDTGKVEVDMIAVAERRDSIVNDFRIGTHNALQKNGVKVIYGNASFISSDVVRVESESGDDIDLTADHFFLNMGAHPDIPDVPGIYDTSYHTSTSILELSIIPEHLIILGGGYIALEMGQMFRRLGSKVTILVRGSRLLAREDEDVSMEMKKILEEEGIDIYFNTKILSVADHLDFNVVTFDGKNTKTVAGSHLLVATGRKPSTPHMNLELAAVDLDDNGYIIVDDYLRTTNKRIYALGDIKKGPAFTHISYNDYLVVYHHLLKHEAIDLETRMVPYCVFTDPELARIGLSERQAKEMGLDFMVATLPMASVARAVEIGETRGFIKALTDTHSGEILGACVIGVQGGELMSILQIAMMGKLSSKQLIEAVFAHPTIAESLNNLFLRLKKPDES